MHAYKPKKDEKFEEFGAGNRNSLDTNPSESSARRPPVGGDAEWSGSSEQMEKMKGEGWREAGIKSRSMSSSPPSADMAAVVACGGGGRRRLGFGKEGRRRANGGVKLRGVPQ